MERQNKSHKYHRPSIFCTVPCTVYIVQCTVYSVQCTVYSVLCTGYRIHFLLLIFLVFVLGGQTMKKSHKHHRPSIVPNVLYRVQCTVYSVQGTVYIFFFSKFLFGWTNNEKVLKAPHAYLFSIMQQESASLGVWVLVGGSTLCPPPDGKLLKKEDKNATDLLGLKTVSGKAAASVLWSP